jgi:mono/diheme cytochrome c family protein
METFDGPRAVCELRVPDNHEHRPGIRSMARGILRCAACLRFAASEEKGTHASPRMTAFARNTAIRKVYRFAAVAIAGVALLAGCGGKDLSKETDAQLGLNAQQSAGRAVFEADCAACHYAYSSSGLKGPGLKGLFHKKYLPSGLPANNRFVEQTIVNGRGMMPGQGEALTDQQLADLMAYLHTL